MKDKRQLNSQQKLDWGREVLSIESKSLAVAERRLGDSFVKAVDTILESKGRVIVTGLGKSGHVARKIASTLSSTGTPALFLHPTEALHGDLGVITAEDVLVAVAYGGETHEVLEVTKYAGRLGIPIIAVTGRIDSNLAKFSNIVLDGAAEREACPLNLAPTVSSTIALALGDSLAIALMRCRGITDEDFAKFHPGGSLGKRLYRIADIMRSTTELQVVYADTSFVELVERMNQNIFGIVAVCGPDDKLIGAITDGDIRRVLLKAGRDAHEMTVDRFMTRYPKTLSSEAMVFDAVRLMESHKITSVFITSSENQKLLGIIRLHDLIEAKIL